MEHRDWARATETTATVYAPTSPDHPQLGEEQYQDAALNVLRWVVALDYGDGSLLIEGDAHELLNMLTQAVSGMRASSPGASTLIALSASLSTTVAIADDRLRSRTMRLNGWALRAVEAAARKTQMLAEHLDTLKRELGELSPAPTFGDVPGTS